MKIKSLLYYGTKVAVRAFFLAPLLMLATPLYLLIDWLEEDKDVAKGMEPYWHTTEEWQKLINAIGKDWERMGK